MRTVSRSAVNRDRHPSSPPLVEQTLTQNVLPFLPQPLNHMVKYSASPLQTSSYNLYHILAASYISTEYNIYEGQFYYYEENSQRTCFCLLMSSFPRKKIRTNLFNRVTLISMFFACAVSVCYCEHVFEQQPADRQSLPEDSTLLLVSLP